MILVDTNVVMYAAGAAHPNRDSSIRLLRRIARGEVEAVIDVELLQEILHRYRSINRWKDATRVYWLTRETFPMALAINEETLDAAKAIMDKAPIIKTRDAIHAAVARLNSIEAICSFDGHFDKVPGIRRVEPDDVK